MANYAFGSRRQVRPNATFQSSFLDQLAGSPIQRMGWDMIPDEAYHKWLQWMSPYMSMRDDNTMRQLFTRLHSNYNAHNASALENQDLGAYTSFFDYLQNVNPEYELNRTGPQARRQENRRFTTPSRWITF